MGTFFPLSVPMGEFGRGQGLGILASFGAFGGVVCIVAWGEGVMDWEERSLIRFWRCASSFDSSLSRAAWADMCTLMLEIILVMVAMLTGLLVQSAYVTVAFLAAGFLKVKGDSGGNCSGSGPLCAVASAGEAARCWSDVVWRFVGIAPFSGLDGGALVWAGHVALLPLSSAWLWKRWSWVLQAPPTRVGGCCADSRKRSVTRGEVGNENRVASRKQSQSTHHKATSPQKASSHAAQRVAG